jgi:hypothetical protein
MKRMLGMSCKLCLLKALDLWFDCGKFPSLVWESNSVSMFEHERTSLSLRLPDVGGTQRFLKMFFSCQNILTFFLYPSVSRV